MLLRFLDLVQVRSFRLLRNVRLRFDYVVYNLSTRYKSIVCYLVDTSFIRCRPRSRNDSLCCLCVGFKAFLFGFAVVIRV